MQGMKKRRLNGFTLVEIMIVVAIIGLLAAVAIPNLVKHANRPPPLPASIISNHRRSERHLGLGK